VPGITSSPDFQKKQKKLHEEKASTKEENRVKHGSGISAEKRKRERQVRGDSGIRAKKKNGRRSSRLFKGRAKEQTKKMVKGQGNRQYLTSSPYRNGRSSNLRRGAQEQQLELRMKKSAKLPTSTPVLHKRSKPEKRTALYAKRHLRETKRKKQEVQSKKIMGRKPVQLLTTARKSFKSDQEGGELSG